MDNFTMCNVDFEDFLEGKGLNMLILNFKLFLFAWGKDEHDKKFLKYKRLYNIKPSFHSCLEPPGSPLLGHLLIVLNVSFRNTLYVNTCIIALFFLTFSLLVSLSPVQYQRCPSPGKPFTSVRPELLQSFLYYKHTLPM
jgi:hypothetical protein